MDGQRERINIFSGHARSNNKKFYQQTGFQGGFAVGKGSPSVFALTHKDKSGKTVSLHRDPPVKWKTERFQFMSVSQQT